MGVLQPTRSQKRAGGQIGNSVTVLIGIKDISNTIPVLVGQFNAAVIDIPWIVINVFQIIDRVADIAIGIVIRNVDSIVDSITISIGACQRQTTFVNIINAIVVTVGVQVVSDAIAIGIFGCSEHTTMFNRRIVKGIDNTITISIRSDCRRLIAKRRLSFNRISNAIVVAVEIAEIGDAISIGICRRCAELIPGSVAIAIGKPSSSCLGGVDHSAHIGVSINRKLISTFD